MKRRICETKVLPLSSQKDFEDMPAEAIANSLSVVAGFMLAIPQTQARNSFRPCAS